MTSTSCRVRSAPTEGKERAWGAEGATDAPPPVSANEHTLRECSLFCGGFERRQGGAQAFGHAGQHMVVPPRSMWACCSSGAPDVVPDDFVEYDDEAVTLGTVEAAGRSGSMADGAQTAVDELTQQVQALSCHLGHDRDRTERSSAGAMDRSDEEDDTDGPESVRDAARMLPCGARLLACSPGRARAPSFWRGQGQRARPRH